jgi:hypothetical protein
MSTLKKLVNSILKILIIAIMVILLLFWLYIVLGTAIGGT